MEENDVGGEEEGGEWEVRGMMLKVERFGAGEEDGGAGSGGAGNPE